MPMQRESQKITFRTGIAGPKLPKRAEARWRPGRHAFMKNGDVYQLQANFEAVAGGRNSVGQSLQPIPLVMPQPKFLDGNRLPACYCNYYLANGAVIMPTFGDPADDAAMQLLQDCYPDRTITGVDAIDLIWGLGAFHCMTQQQPSA